jgi:hypothetical protein
VIRELTFEPYEDRSISLQHTMWLWKYWCENDDPLKMDAFQTFVSFSWCDKSDELFDVEEFLQRERKLISYVPVN